MQKTVFLSLICILSASPALADKIDGSWCDPASTDRMTIDGPRVVTPGGTQVEAHYTRHTIDYDIPDGERPKGGRIRADQIDDSHIKVSRILAIQKEPPAHDTWERCKDLS